MFTINNEFNQADPYELWFQTPIQELKLNMRTIHDISSYRYMTILNYDDIDSLKNINLHLFAGGFDPFIDNSVWLAKKWRGQFFDFI